MASAPGIQEQGPIRVKVNLRTTSLATSIRSQLRKLGLKLPENRVPFERYVKQYIKRD